MFWWNDPVKMMMVMTTRKAMQSEKSATIVHSRTISFLVFGVGGPWSILGAL